MKILISLFFVLSLFSCSSIKKSEKQDYLSFRNTQKKFTSKDGALKYIDEGIGENVILLLHGVPSSSWLYRKMIPLLVKNGYRVIAPDMLGFGSSDNPNGYELYNQSNHAKRIISLMDSLEIKNWHHVMHDAGGLWTWEIIKQQPNRINKLTVLNTIVYKEGFHPPITFKKGFLAKTSMWLYNNNITTNSMLIFLFNEGLTSPDKLTKAEFYGYKKPLIENKTKGMYYFFTRTCNLMPDYSDVFENIQIPVQFIWGKNDEMLTIKPQLDDIKKGFKVEDINIHLLNAKHFIQEEKPEEIVAIIKNF